ncbi:VacJ family lipoprotein [Neisseriaceae bacterium B1]
MKPIIVATLCLGLFAPTAFADNTNDPYEKYNRAMFKFNDKADQYVFQPVARGYRKVTPKSVRGAVRNFFDNLRDMQSFGSNVLRGNVKNASYDFMRVAINTTFGLGGLINIADEAGMQNNKNTLGDTFATWGWKNSNYFVMPLTGPSTVRDSVGSTISSVYAPEALIHENTVRYSLPVLNAVDKRESLLETTDALDQMALDKYIVTRDAYIALRNKSLGIENPQEELIDPEAELSSDNIASEPAASGIQAQPETPLVPQETVSDSQ